jgi:hypothetical protein
MREFLGGLDKPLRKRSATTINAEPQRPRRESLGRPEGLHYQNSFPFASDESQGGRASVCGNRCPGSRRWSAQRLNTDALSRDRRSGRRAGAVPLRASVSFVLADAMASCSAAISACARSAVGVKRTASACDRATADAARLLFQVSGPFVRVDRQRFRVNRAVVGRTRRVFRAARSSLHVAEPSVRAKRSLRDGYLCLAFDRSRCLNRHLGWRRRLGRSRV